VPRAPRHRERHGATFDVEAVIHNFDEKVFFAENVSKFGGGIERFFVLPNAQSRLNFTTHAARRANKAFAVGSEQLAVHAGLEVVPLQ
jgi:hypothetical protein